MMKERSNQRAMAQENAREGQEQRTEKKPYQTPELTKLGNVKEVTQEGLAENFDGFEFS